MLPVRPPKGLYTHSEVHHSLAQRNIWHSRMLTFLISPIGNWLVRRVPAVSSRVAGHCAITGSLCDHENPYIIAFAICFIWVSSQCGGALQWLHEDPGVGFGLLEAREAVSYGQDSPVNSTALLLLYFTA